MKQLNTRRNLVEVNTKTENRLVKQALTSNKLQFKKERIDKKVAVVILKTYNVTLTNVYERQTGQTLTPLISGKI